MNAQKRCISLPLVAAALAALSACSSPTGPGALSVQLTASPGSAAPPVSTLKGIIVTIDQVTAHSDAGGWVVVFQGPLTVDLLQLSTATRQMGPVSVPAGTVTQVRFVLDPAGPQYVVLADGT
ncbi:MAG TPA: DUF4382 domain-containing protein, partial [Myxococcaceae bacterium]|nr:DUF4382 domain-containing protein [Myxococcaceae bacterium]